VEKKKCKKRRTSKATVIIVRPNLNRDLKKVISIFYFVLQSLLNNIKWYENTNIIGFLSTYGKYFRMGDLLSRKQ
jgi:tyrosyl-tRNA synthetase